MAKRVTTPAGRAADRSEGNPGDAPSLKQRMLSGDLVVGTFLQTPHRVVGEFVGSLGFDAVCLEAEHSAYGAEHVQQVVAALALTAARPLVRVADNEWARIAVALDAGAEGVIVPRVNSAEEARAVARAALYPPAGDRGIGPGRVTGFGLDAGPAYRARANERNLVGVQVETRAAVDRVDEIAAADGVDMVFIGPSDLSSSLALEPGSAELDAVIARLVERSLAAGKLVGIFAGMPEAAARWAGEGVRLVLLASELVFLARGAAAARQRLADLVVPRPRE